MRQGREKSNCEFSSCKLRAVVRDEYVRDAIPGKYSFHFFDDATGGHRVSTSNFNEVAVVVGDDEQGVVFQLTKVGSNFCPRPGCHFML